MARHAVLELIGHMGERYGPRLAVRDEIIRGHEALTARSLFKQRQYGRDLAAVLVARGIPEEIGALAAHIALACYSVAYDTGGSAEELRAAAERAFAALRIVIPDGGSTHVGRPDY